MTEETLQDYITFKLLAWQIRIRYVGNLPIKYDLSENQYILTDITDKCGMK